MNSIRCPVCGLYVFPEGVAYTTGYEAFSTWETQLPWCRLGFIGTDDALVARANKYTERGCVVLNKEPPRAA